MLLSVAARTLPTTPPPYPLSLGFPREEISTPTFPRVSGPAILRVGWMRLEGQFIVKGRAVCLPMCSGWGGKHSGAFRSKAEQME